MSMLDDVENLNKKSISDPSINIHFMKDGKELKFKTNVYFCNKCFNVQSFIRNFE